MGNSDRGLGGARCEGPDRGLRPALVGGQRDRRRAVHRVAGRDGQQVLLLAGALRPGQRAQRLGCLGLLVGGLGKAGHHRVPPEESLGRLSEADVHDAGRGYGGGEPGQRVAGARARRDCSASGTGSRPRKGGASNNRPRRTSTGTSTFPISTLRGRFITSARCWTASAGPLCTGICGRP